MGMSNKRKRRGNGSGRSQPSERRPEPRLYLITPASPPEGFAVSLEAALSEADVACVLVAGADEAAIAAVAAIARRHEAAVLADDADVARRLGLDGAHVRGLERTLAALGELKPQFIVGASGLHSRHDCMEAGERDIDYLMFGDPAPDGFIRPLDDTLERVSWWAEIFNVPCVAYAAQFGDIPSLVAAGAEFIALGAALWDDPRGAAVAVRAAEDLAIAAMTKA